METAELEPQVAQLSRLSDQAARQEEKNKILRWATAHRDALKQAGLLESLLQVLS